MTVNNLIKQLQKLPGKAKIAVDVTFSGKEWKYELVELKPYLKEQVEMHDDWHENRRGRPKHLNMVIIGAIVGDYLE